LPEVQARLRRILFVVRVDVALMFLIVFDMSRSRSAEQPEQERRYGNGEGRGRRPQGAQRRWPATWTARPR
jgi:hypothetical protein